MMKLFLLCLAALSVLRAEAAQIMEALGQGYCDAGYIRGWDGKGIESTEACNALCLSESDCYYAAFFKGSTCSRYNEKTCNLNDNKDHFTSKKVDATYQAVGCFADNQNRAISGKLTTYSPSEAIKKCFERAQAEGNEYFALQHDEECFTSKDAGSTYNKYGSATGCKDGRGGGWKQDVYRIVPVAPVQAVTAPPPTEAPMTCSNGKRVGESFINAECTRKCTCRDNGIENCVSLCPPSTLRCSSQEMMEEHDRPVAGSNCTCKAFKCIPKPVALAQAVTEAPSPGCLTVSGPVTGAPCVFPFIYESVTYTSCTMMRHDQKWCSTKVDENGKYISGEYGNCPAEPNSCRAAPVQTLPPTAAPVPDESCPKIKVLSNDHKSGERGMYFNFDGKSIDWKGQAKMALQVLNTRNGKKGEVMMWYNMQGGSKGTAHGRWNPFSSKKKGDWQVGDVLAVYCSADCNLDLVVVMDGSYSQTHKADGQASSGWKKQVQFAKRLVGEEKKGVRVAVVVYSEKASVASSFLQHQSDLASFLDTLKGDGYISRMDLALKTAQSTLAGSRDGSSKRVIILSDGDQTTRRLEASKVNPQPIANALRSSGVKLEFMAVKDYEGDVKHDEMVAVAGGKQNVFSYAKEGGADAAIASVMKCQASDTPQGTDGDEFLDFAKDQSKNYRIDER